MHIEFITIQAATDVPNETPLTLEDIIEAPISKLNYEDSSYMPMSLLKSSISQHVPSDLNNKDWTDVYTVSGEIYVAAMPYHEFRAMMQDNKSKAWSINKSNETKKLSIKWL